MAKQMKIKILISIIIIAAITYLAYYNGAFENNKDIPINPEAPEFYWEYETTDAGKLCFDNAECEGSCLSTSETTGECSETRGGKSACGITMINGTINYEKCIIA